MPSPPRWLGRSSHHTDSIQQHHTEHSCMDSRLHYAFLQSASLQCWFFFWFPRYSLCSRVQTVKQLSDLHCFGCFCKLRIVVKVAAHLLLTFLSDPDHLGVRQVEHIDSIDCEQNVAHTGEERDWREKGRVIKSYHEYIEVSLHQKDPGLKEMYQKELQTWKNSSSTWGLKTQQECPARWRRRRPGGSRGYGSRTLLPLSAPALSCYTLGEGGLQSCTVFMTRNCSSLIFIVTLLKLKKIKSFNCQTNLVCLYFPSVILLSLLCFSLVCCNLLHFVLLYSTYYQLLS